MLFESGGTGARPNKHALNNVAFTSGMGGASTGDRLYNLMPAIYRIRDLEVGQTLRAYMAVLERMFGELQDDMDALYDDWFIETCHERIVPYIAELVGLADLLDPRHAQGTRRRHVANITSYRRTTGALPTLRNVARDLTGWPVEVVDLAGLVASTQHVQHARPDSGRSVDVRGMTPSTYARVENFARGVDVRHIVPVTGYARAGYNLNDVGVFFWRLQSYPITESTPFRVGPGRYTFDPTGLDIALFQPARTPPDDSADLAPLPLALLRTSRVYPCPFTVWLAGSVEPVADAEIALADLTGWPSTPAGVRVDPILGRITCAPDQQVRAVSYRYAFSGDVGAGPYTRQTSVVPALAQRPITWRAFVGQSLDADASHLRFHTLSEAVQAWNALPAGNAGVIGIVDSATYASPSDPIAVGEGSFLALLGARRTDEDALVFSMIRPCIDGDLRFTGEAAREPGEVLLDGILCNGALEVQPANLGRLTLAHSTLVPARGGFTVMAGNPRLVVKLENSICGPLRIQDPTAKLELDNTIVDAGGRAAITARDADLDVRGSTVFGATHAGTLHVGDSLLVGRVEAARRQVGTIDYSFVPEGSRTPPRHHCQPDLALAAAPPERHASIRAGLVPAFTSIHYGDAGYAQLTPSTPSELRAGARDDAEMGAFHLLYQPLRMTSFVETLRDYLPAGRDVGVFFVS